jgi:hypothetical protein
MVWLPVARRLVVSVATPPLAVAVPSVVLPSKNVTDPVGVAVAGATGDTVAVKVTGWPNTDGLAELRNAVVVAALVITVVSAASPHAPGPAAALVVSPE